MTTPNASLVLSCRIRDIMKRDTLRFIEPIFPTEAIRSYESSLGVTRRDRVFNTENTLMTMVITALQPDRSLQNSVEIFREVFQHSRDAVLREALEQRRAQKATPESGGKRSRGRPRSAIARIPISKMKDISSNTAAFSKARERVDVGLIQKAFKASTEVSSLPCVAKWHGRTVYNTDGTYFQMQDTPQIPDPYRVQRDSEGRTQGYPQGLLQVLTQHGSGFLSAYRIAGRSSSELDLLTDIVSDLPAETLLLADDLYNCYAMFCLLRERDIDIIVPDKKERRFKVVRQLAPGDQIVEIARPSSCRALVSGQNLPGKLQLRRVTCSDPLHLERHWVLLTTILDESIDKTEIIFKYNSRWDIEISIREIKTLMGINIARAKSEDMVFREIGVALLAYNLVRRIVAQSTAETPFSPETDIYQALYTPDLAPLVDRKGRVYSRWSPGRPLAHHDQTQRTHHPEKAGTTLPSKS